MRDVRLFFCKKKELGGTNQKEPGGGAMDNQEEPGGDRARGNQRKPGRSKRTQEEPRVAHGNLGKPKETHHIWEKDAGS